MLKLSDGTERVSFRFGNELNLHKDLAAQLTMCTEVMKKRSSLEVPLTPSMVDYTLEEAHKLVDVVCGQRAANVKRNRFQLLK